MVFAGFCVLKTREWKGLDDVLEVPGGEIPTRQRNPGLTRGPLLLPGEVYRVGDVIAREKPVDAEDAHGPERNLLRHFSGFCTMRRFALQGGKVRKVWRFGVSWIMW